MSMTLAVIAIWSLAAFVVAVMVGRFIKAGMGEEPQGIEPDFGTKPTKKGCFYGA